jgi:hypothetical protein
MQETDQPEVFRVRLLESLTLIKNWYAGIVIAFTYYTSISTLTACPHLFMQQFLKEILNDLCVYNKRGPNQGTHELKPEYKKSVEDTNATWSLYHCFCLAFPELEIE